MPDPKYKNINFRDKDVDKIMSTQQLSDDLATKVAKKQMTYEKARSIQDKKDAEAMKITHVGRKVTGSSENLPSKTEWTKAKFIRDRRGNLKAK